MAVRSGQIRHANISMRADPSSALMPTYIGANAEPVLSLLYLFLLFSFLLSTYGVPLAAPFRCPIEASRSSGVFRPGFWLTVTGGSTVASEADRPS
jgi:hypothetical protein